MIGQKVRRLAPLVILAVAAVATAAWADEVRIGALDIDDIWARPSAGRTGAVYMEIENEGTVGDRLVAAESPRARKVELHTTRMEGDVMRMRRLEAGIEIPPKGEVALRPGGMHVMLLGLTAPLKAGDRFPLTLTFERAGRTTLEVEVKPMKSGGHMRKN